MRRIMIPHSHLPRAVKSYKLDFLNPMTTSENIGPKADIVILANGDVPRHPTPRKLLAGVPLLVCCDGAVATAIALGREPDFVVGDGDSISPSDRSSLGSRFIHVAEQETNDLSKAFDFACRHAAQHCATCRIAIIGATGLREDHTIGNIFRLADFAAIVPDTVLYTDTGTFAVVRGRRSFACTRGEAVSVFAPVHGTVVTSQGLQWPLDGVSLDALWSGTLNRTTGSAFVIHTNGRPVLVFRPYSS